MNVAMPAPAPVATKHPTVSGPSPTIGLLVDSLDDSYHWSVLRGAMDAARERGAHLLCFAGGVLEAPSGGGGERNSVFDLATPASVDALVVTGAIGNHVGPDRLQEYCKRFRPLPMCSIAVELADMSSVCIDNESGMRVAVEHLIREHGMKRIAFVRGPLANAEAERRFGVYKQALERSGIAFCPELVAVGDFEQRGGREATRTLLGDHKLSADNLDAIVAANDAMAVGVLDELGRRDIRVPDGIAVVGFDDIEESRFTIPPLTTVRQPLYEQGRDAVRIVLDRLRLRDRRALPPERIVRRTELITRQSCGCLVDHGASSTSPDTARTPGVESALVECHRRIRTENRARSLGRASAAIASAHDLDELSRAVADHLPALGIARCYVATFDRGSGDARLARLALVQTLSARKRPLGNCSPRWRSCAIMCSRTSASTRSPYFPRCSRTRSWASWYWSSKRSTGTCTRLSATCSRPPWQAPAGPELATLRVRRRIR
jgi:DNA-binding LacI/PurR family transcriptional regulator